MKNNWKIAWSYRPIDYGEEVGKVNKLTQRLFSLCNLNGNAVRIKLSNFYSLDEMYIKHASVGVVDSLNDKRIKNKKELTVNSEKEFVIDAGKSCYSDSIEIEVKAGQYIVVSLFMEKCSLKAACTVCSQACTKVLFVNDCDTVLDDSTEGVGGSEIFLRLKEENPIPNVIIGVEQIEVLTEEEVSYIVLFGDSITHMSFYHDAFCKKIYERYPGKVSVLNRGVSGNRMLRDAIYAPKVPGNGRCFGPAGIKRFEKDVFGECNPRCVLFLEGINDIMLPYAFELPEERTTVSLLCEGMESIIDMVHKKNAKMLIGTVMPFRTDSLPFIRVGNEQRMEFNSWIRLNESIDGVLDFDENMKEVLQPEYMKKEYHLGDGVHPNGEGGAVMADIALDVIEKLGILE